MSKGLLVALREYFENLRTKTFWLGILAFPLILVASVIIPRFFSDAKDVRYYAVWDQSDDLLAKIEDRAAFPDMKKLLARARDARKSDPELYDKFPEALRQATEGLEVAMDQLPEGKRGQALDAFAALFGMARESNRGEIPPNTPPILVKAIEELRPQAEKIAKWYRELEPEEADDYGRGLARGKYRRLEREVSSEEDLKELLDAGEIFAYFVIGKDFAKGNQANLYVSKNTTDDALRDWFSNHATAVVEKQRFAEREIDPEVVAAIKAPVVFRAKNLGSDGKTVERTSEAVTRDYAPVAFVYVLWIAIFTITQMLLTNTIEEKSNRIIEVLLSSISPIQLMFGKIAGIAATGLTVVLSWIFFLFIALKFFLPAMNIEPPFDLTFILKDQVYLASFIGYFILGYLFYSALLVGIGSVCNSLKEAQNLQTPITIVLMVPLFAMLPIVQDPNGTLARALSYIPPLTPFVMMNRAAGPPSTMDYLVTSLLLVASILFLFWGAAKIFRVGILMTGKPPKFGEILRWLRAPIGSVPAKKD